MRDIFKPRFGDPEVFFDSIDPDLSPEERQQALHKIISNLTLGQWNEVFPKRAELFTEHTQHCAKCYTIMAEIGNASEASKHKL